jgi:hypothetical protein
MNIGSKLFRYIFLLSMLILPLFAVTQYPSRSMRLAAFFRRQLQITPSAPVLGPGAGIKLTSNQPVTWSLAPGSVGTLVSDDGQHATYTAPQSVDNQNTLAGCPVYPNDTVFNTRIDNLPAHKSSSTWTANMGTLSVSFLPSWGLNIADSTTPTAKESFFYSTGNNGLFVLPVWPNLKREGGTFITPFNSTDHHIVTLRKDTCRFYELYNDFLNGPRMCRDGITAGCTAASGTIYSGLGYALPQNGTTDAAGLPLAPLSLHLAEIKANAIHHALRFTVAGGYIQATSGSTFLWPATVGNFSGPASPNFPPYGARFRLKRTYDITRFSPIAQTILKALKEYGMMLADAGTGPAITTFTDVTEDDAAMQAFDEISKAGIKMPEFEAVDESSLMVSAGSAEVSLSNGFVVPEKYAAVYATDRDNANHRAVAHIALRAVSIGMPSPEIFIAAGTPAYQLPFWVSGTDRNSATWSLVSGPGSVSPNGFYTPPNAVSSIARSVLRVSAVADPNAKAALYVNVFPAPAGAIRINSGGGSFTDANGHVFLPDTGLETGAHAATGGDWPAWKTSDPDRVVYESVDVTWADDLVYTFVVPNGHYKVRFMLGQPYNGVGTPGGTYPPEKHLHAPMHLEANGQIGAHNFDLGLATGYKWATPDDVYVPATVTNNILTVAARGVAPDDVTNYVPAPQIGGLEIVPDSTAPHLAIDTEQHVTISQGSKLHLHAVGWYMSNAVTWSVSGAGTIDDDGLYTPPKTGHSKESVTITASSKTRPDLSATATLRIE